MRAGAEPVSGDSARDAWGVVVVGADGVIQLAQGPALAALRLADLEGRRAASLPPTFAALVAVALDGTRATASVVVDDRTVQIAAEPSAGGALVLLLAPPDPAALATRQVQLLLQQVPAMVWATDADQRVTHVLGKLPRVLVVDPATMIGVEADQYLREHGAASVAEAQGRAIARREEQLLRLELIGRSLEVAIEPLIDAGGAVVGCVGAAIDVTPLLSADRARAASEARLAEAQKLAHVGSFEWDVPVDRVLWSDEMFRIHGIGREGFDRRYASVRRLVHPDDLAMLDQRVRECLKDKVPLRAEYRIIRPDGATRTLEARADVVTDASGEVVRVAGTLWDETELAETRRARDRTHSLLAATLEATADGILVVDRDAKVVAHNARFVSIWRIPAALIESGDDDALLAYVREQLVDPDAFMRGVRDLYEHPEAESRDHLRFVDGRVVERISKPQRLDGEIVGRVWSFHDVTEREHLLGRTELLAEASRLLTSLEAEGALEALAQIVVGRFASACAVDILDAGGPRRLTEISDEPRHEPVQSGRAALCGRTVAEAVDGWSRISVPLAVRGEVLGALHLRKRGAYELAEVELAEELGRRAGLAVQNARLYATAREALHAREELLAIAAHEIRGPITSLHLAVQSLRAESLPERVRTRLYDIIEREDRRLARFVDELLDIGALSAGSLELTREEVSLANVVHRVVANADAEIRHGGSAVDVLTDDAAVGSWDPYRLQQVIENLLSNALKFGAGAPIEIRVRSEDSRAILSVSDHGIGIPGELHERIFQPFERGRISSRHYGGLGLGLHISRAIIEGLGGDIRVESAPGEGATFTVSLPKEAP